MLSVAWFAIFNHCALAGLPAMQARPAIASCKHCAGDQSPVQNKDANGSECCKTLHATLAAAKKLVVYDTSLFVSQFYFVASELLLNDSKASVCGTEFDTGPPFAKTFAESILQRSILAHAPPLA
jgi:hypothetical protein